MAKSKPSAGQILGFVTCHWVIYGIKTQIYLEVDSENQLPDFAFLVALTAYLHEFSICL